MPSRVADSPTLPDLLYFITTATIIIAIAIITSPPPPAGLAAPLSDESGWAYSPALLDLVGEYRRRFPWMFTALESSSERGA